jgi:hypothetical protein
MLDAAAAPPGRQQALLLTERTPESRLFSFLLRVAGFLASPWGLAICLVIVLATIINACGVVGGNVSGGKPTIMVVTFVELQVIVGLASIHSLRHLNKPLSALCEKRGTLTKTDEAAIRNCCIVLGVVALGTLGFYAFPANGKWAPQYVPNAFLRFCGKIAVVAAVFPVASGIAWVVALWACAAAFRSILNEIEAALSEVGTSEEALHASIVLPCLAMQADVIPALDAAFAPHLLCVSCGVVAWIVLIVVQFVLPVPGVPYDDGQAALAIFAAVLVALIALLILSIPASITGRCQRLLRALNMHALRFPQLNKPIKYAERRLAGGFSPDAVNTFGFTLFGVLLNTGLLKTAATTLVGLGATAIPVITNYAHHGDKNLSAVGDWLPMEAGLY